jgi:hypothetical protein
VGGLTLAVVDTVTPGEMLLVRPDRLPDNGVSVHPLTVNATAWVSARCYR